MPKKIYTVSQINTYIRDLIGQDFILRNVQISGEVSDCKYHSSGHIYFTIKDDSGTLSGIMFAGDKGGLKFRLEEGQNVIVTGRVGVYGAQSKYQIYAKKIELDGQGLLFQRFEQLKNELAELGIFDEMYKQPIPKFVKKVGVVTAPTGAAIRDIIQISGRRNPYVQLILYPALVQGENAAPSIVRGIETLDEMGLDVIIVGRGGGSMEDLWAFNERIVCEAVFNAHTPVISAVGHETDYSLCDLAADLRAPTPSAAAELAVFSIAEHDEMINSLQRRMKLLMNSRIDRERHIYTQRQLRLSKFDPVPVIDQLKMKVADAEARMKSGMDKHIKDERKRLVYEAARLEALSPLARLQSGYAYLDEPDGTRITSVKQLNVNDELRVRISDGAIIANVKDIIPSETEAI